METGDTAFRINGYIDCHCRQQMLVSVARGTQITAYGINEDMLSVRRSGAISNYASISFVAGNVQEFPFDDLTVDIYSISFGMRNVPCPDLTLSEALRVLKPGVRYMMLEFAKCKSLYLRQTFTFWLFKSYQPLGAMSRMTRSPTGSWWRASASFLRKLNLSR